MTAHVTHDLDTKSAVATSRGTPPSRAPFHLTVINHANISIAPINRLPPEIFLAIIRFHPSLLSEIELQLNAHKTHEMIDGHYRWLNTLRRVCSSWGVVLDSTPSFWCWVSSRFHPKFLQTVVGKSGDHQPLSICVLDDGKHALDQPTVMAIHRLSHRWQLLHIESRTVDAIQMLVTAPHPILQFASITVYPGGLDAPTYVLPLTKFSGLTHLRIQLQMDDSIRNNLLETLRTSPLLSELVLKDRDMSTSGTTASTTPLSSRIQLPCLKVTNLTGASIISHVLKHFTVPLTSRLYLCSSRCTSTIVAHAQERLAALDAADACLAPSTSVSVWVNTRNWIGVDYGSGYCTLQLIGPRLADDTAGQLQSLFTAIPPSRRSLTSVVEVRCEIASFPRRILPVLSALFPMVKELHIEEPRLRILAEKGPAHQFPHLQTIVVSSRKRRTGPDALYGDKDMFTHLR
ncbi:hypothetical protein FRB99_001495, partial [Tulasnella sp. 403]